MSEIVWQDPPETPRGMSGRCRQFVEALKSRPGEWALYPTPMSSAGSATTYRTTYPEVEWTVRVRPDRKYDMYGRWIGEAKP